MFVLAMMPIQGGNTVRKLDLRIRTGVTVGGKLAVGRNLQLRFGSALKHHRLNIAGSSRGFPQEQRQSHVWFERRALFRGPQAGPRSRIGCPMFQPSAGSNCSKTLPGQFSKLAIADSRAELFLRIPLPENLALLARPGSRRRAISGWI